MIIRGHRLNGLAGLNYSAMRWSDLMRQAKADHMAGWERGMDVFSGGTTSIGGLQAQIYLTPIDPLVSGAPELINPYSDLAARMQQTDAATWGFPGYEVLLNLKDPDGPPDMMTSLSRGANDTVAVTHYPIQDGLPWGLIAVIALPFAVAGLQAIGMLGAAEVGAVVAPEIGGTITAAQAATSEALFDAWVTQQAAAESLIGIGEFGGITASWEGALSVGATTAAEAAVSDAAFDTWAAQQAALESTVPLEAFGGATASWEGLLTTTATVAPSASNMLPSTAREWINVARTAVGVTSAVTGASGATSRTPTRTTTSTRLPAQTYLPNQTGTRQVVTTASAQADNSALWLGLAGAAAVALFLR